MQRLLILAVLSSTLPAAHADLVLVQRIEGTSQNGTMTTLRLKGSKLRVDLASRAGPVSFVMDLETGGALTLRHDEKVMTRVSGAQAKESSEALRKEAGKKPETGAGKPEAAGRREKIGEFNTEVFTWNGVNGRQTIWVTKDLPNYAKVKEQCDRLSKSAFANVLQGAGPDLTALPGVVVKTELEREGKKFTMTVLSVKDEEQNPAHFEASPDYRELEKRAKPKATPPAEPTPAR